ncbi:gamma-glutamyltransferase family protein [Burkholderia pseudomultivorans]|uniref:gamma-glutamyltransferase family protein n=1 Tax=Burkholderia pseudomultivorans TaxID=1207504 RepID=UPI000755A536|nr:gamma-glutamyltransferase family protein [Burkholderia pseudomultivorans]KWF02897.1 gamma-glutamyltransferase [Burkholderia pseudomultivorans]
MRNFEMPGRSLVVARNGMAATSHPSATLAAIDVLAAGGNAMDAAIAACAVQCVVEPGSTGVGGDCFALYSRGGSDDVIAYDGSGWAPAAASVERLRALGVDAIGRHSAHAVTVPGAVDAWTALHRDHGRLPLRDVLAPAIRHAEHGYAVAPRTAADWAKEVETLTRDPGARAAMLVDGAAPRAGTAHRQPRLANTLRAIAETGRDGFYRGAVAADLVGHLQAHGGLHTLDDFAEYRGEYVTPIRARYRGYDVIECPPAGQGVVALLLLRLLDKFDAHGDPLDPDRLHREIEAAKLAYGVRDAVLGDPRHARVDVEGLLADGFVDALRGRIDLDRVLTPTDALTRVEHRDTVYITVVDRDRNCVSFINSLFYSFGTGLMGPSSGVMLHNRGQCFVVEPGHPNAIAPRKRPLHTIIPGMVARDGRVCMSFGVMGGHYQAMGHAHFLSKVLHYGMDLQSAMDLPRVFPRPGSATVEVESTLPAAARAALIDRGFTLVPAPGAIGGAQAIWIDWDEGVLTGASDHRKDGCALGY